METPLVPSSPSSLPYFSQWKLNTYDFGQISRLGIPTAIFAIATAYAPVTCTLTGLGVTFFSIMDMRELINNGKYDPIKAAQMITVALVITSIALSGLSVGLTPLCARILLLNFPPKASAFLILLPFGLSLLTGLWGYVGGGARSALGAIGSLPAEKIIEYIKELRASQKPLSIWDALCLHAFIAFRKDIQSLVNSMPRAVQNFRATFAPEAELNEIISSRIDKIRNLKEQLPHVGWTSRLKISNEIDETLSYLPQIISRLSIEDQIKQTDAILNELQTLSLPEARIACCSYLNEYYLNMNSQFNEIPKILVDKYKEINENFSSKLTSQQLYQYQIDLQTLSSEWIRYNWIVEVLNSINPSLEVEKSEDFISLTENLQHLRKKTDELQSEIQKNKNISDLKLEEKDKIDREDTVWNALILIEGNSSKMIKETMEELCQILEVENDDTNAMDSELTKLGLNNVQALFDNNIVTEDEFIKIEEEERFENKEIAKTSIKNKIFAHIKQKKASSIDLHSRIYTVLAAEPKKRDMSRLYRTTSTIIYRATMAFSILAPLMACYQRAIVGLAVGIVGFGVYSCWKRKRISIHEAGEYFFGGPRFTHQLFTMLITRRTLLTHHPSFEKDLDTFVNADFFGKFRLLSMELGITAASSIISFAANGKNENDSFSGRDSLLIDLFPIGLGAMLGREFVDGAFYGMQRLKAFLNKNNDSLNLSTRSLQ